MQWLCLLKDHQLGGWPFWTNLVLADHKVHGYPYKAGVSCVDKGALEEGPLSMCPLQAAKALGEGMPQTPESDDRVKSPPSPGPASDATSQDTGQRHVLTRGPPQKHAQPGVSGATGRWTVPRDALTCLERSPPPRPGEWSVHRDNLAPWRDPHFTPNPNPTL